MRRERDAFGQEMYDYYHSDEEEPHIYEIIERDDGFIDVAGRPAGYFAPFDEWPPHQQEAMDYVQGRVLDVGCGPGRVCLYLQSQGHDVVGIDNSPLAIEIARDRGVQDAHLMSITKASANTLGVFDTIVMLGNNFGLLANPKRARWLLRRFYHMTSPAGRIVAETNDIYDTDNPHHLEYHELNRQRGRMPGQIRLRVRHKKTTGAWFDYLMVSPAEMDDLLDGTGWHVTHRFHADESAQYVALIEKT